MRFLNEIHDPGLHSWIEPANAPASDFTIQNLPFGGFRRRATKASLRCSAAIGDPIVDLPVGYHGRTSSLLVPRESSLRPTGQHCRR